jgi:hypothetical protein
MTWARSLGTIRPVPLGRSRRGLCRLVACATVALACGTEPCTLIGCYDGLVIELPASMVAPVRVAIDLPDGTRQEQVCPGSLGCSRTFFFTDVSASSVVVHVSVGDAPVYTVARDLEYESVYPNGPGCDPGCRVARVQIKQLT